MNCLKYVHSDITPEHYNGGGGGIIGDIVEIGTGGLVKSGKTKDKIKAAEQAQQAQAKIVSEQKDEVEAEEEERKKRVMKSRQGRRGLLYKGGDETGVGRVTTLGGN